MVKDKSDDISHTLQDCSSLRQGKMSFVCSQVGVHLCFVVLRLFVCLVGSSGVLFGFFKQQRNSDISVWKETSTHFKQDQESHIKCP